MSKKFDEAVFRILEFLVMDSSDPAIESAEKHLEILRDCLAKSKAFVPPTPLQVKEYAASLGKHIMGHDFCDFYESKGWMVGKNKMKSWQAAVRNWLKRDKPNEMPIETIEARLERLKVEYS